MTQLQSSTQHQVVDVTLTNFSGKKVSIMELFLGITISESIYNSTLSAKVMLEDTVELSRIFPLIGEEIFTISYKVNPAVDELIEREFYVYNVAAEATGDNASGKVMALQMCSIEMMHSVAQKISTHWAPSVGFKKFVENIFKKVDSGKKELIFDPDLQDLTINQKYSTMIPFMKPLDIIRYACRSLYSPQRQSPCLFFENVLGFHLVSVDYLYSRQSIGKWSSTLMPLFNDLSVAEKMRVIESYNYTGEADSLLFMQTGSLNLHVATYDPFNKKYVDVIENKRNKRKQFDKFSADYNTGGYYNKSDEFVEQFSSDARQSYRYVIKNEFGRNSAEIEHSKNQTLALLDMNKITATLASAQYLTVGDKITLEIPKLTPVKDEMDESDKILSGDYLITRLTREMSLTKSTTSVELVRHGRGEKIEVKV